MLVRDFGWSRWVVVLLCICLGPATVCAQSLLGDLMEERTVSVDVWATDKKGRPAEGLTDADFELLEDGQPVPLSRVELGSDALRLVLYFDNVHTRRSGRDRVISDLEKALPQNLGSGSEVMIVTDDGVLTVRQPFTDDRGKIATTLSAVAATEPAGEDLASERSELLSRLDSSKGDCETALPEVRSYAETVNQRVEQSLARLETLVRSMAKLEDRKAVLLISDGLELFSGQDAFVHLASACGGDRQAMEEQGREFDSSKGLIHLAAVANSKDTSIVVIEAAGPLSSSSSSPSKAKQKAKIGDQPTGMVMKSADGVPMVPVAGLGESGGGEPTADQIRARSLRSGAAFLAGQTGGFTVFGTKNFKSHFDTLRSELMPYYRLVYTPERPADGRVHVLEVRTTKKGLDTRFNQSYLDQRVVRDFGDRLMAYLLYETKSRIGSVSPSPSIRAPQAPAAHRPQK